MTDDLVKRLRHYSYEPEFAEAADRIEALEHSYASLQQAFDEMKALAAQRLAALKEAERQRDELLAAAMSRDKKEACTAMAQQSPRERRMSNVQRWTGPVTAFDGGGFVCYGDYLTLEKQLVAAQAREAELVAHVERLREALQFDGFTPSDALHRKIVQEALSATPAQSLAHLRNEVLEEAANVCDARAMKNELAVQDCSRNGEHDEVSSLRSAAWQMSVCADAIRQMKEPE